MGRSRGLLWLLTFLLFVPITLLEWLFLMVLGNELAHAPWLVAKVAIPAIALTIAALIAYRLAIPISKARSPETG